MQDAESLGFLQGMKCSILETLSDQQKLHQIHTVFLTVQEWNP